ncbi:MAG: THUMP domain-containing class I SAM-dependent methyltransferase [Desulfobacterales bacterium]|jgi:23S rRNA G2445 N2-methylase RlmL
MPTRKPNATSPRWPTTSGAWRRKSCTTGITEAYRGIHFSAEARGLHRVNAPSRLISRVLAPLISFQCLADKVLYERASSLHGEEILDPSRTAAVFATATRSAAAITKIHHIRIPQRDALESPPIAGRVVVCNPPDGICTGKEDDLDGFYKQRGNFLTQRCRPSIAFVYFGERALIERLGLKPSWKKPLSPGGLDGRLVKYELY